MLFASVLKCEAIGERLRYRLDREFVARVADLIEVPVPGGDADPKLLRIGFGEFRDIVRNIALLEAGVAFV